MLSFVLWIPGVVFGFGFSWSVAEVKRLKQDSSGRLEGINTKPVCLGQAVSETEPCARMTHTNREVLQLFNCVASLLLPWRNASLAERFAGSSVFASCLSDVLICNV
jgi:hypothetical protein